METPEMDINLRAFKPSFYSSKVFNSTLIVNSDLGCVNKITKEVVVHEKPKLFLEISETCEGSNIEFTLFSIDVVLLQLELGFWRQGKFSSENENPLHTYMDGENLMLN